MKQTRVETDSMGPLEVPLNARYGAQTQRAYNNFRISGIALPPAFIRALAHIKKAAAQTNAELGLLDAATAQAIAQAAERIIAGEYAEQFPLDVFQTGSGTSSNMNMNEVLAHLASEMCAQPVHPNDQVNMSQSSNDVIPSAIHLSAAQGLVEQLQPALVHLESVIRTRAEELRQVYKTGRTHLMDAMPLSLGQELDGWAHQIAQNRERLSSLLPQLLALAQGGTAVGTGVNAPAEFAAHFARQLSVNCGLTFTPSASFFAALGSQDTAVALSGQLRTLAVSLMKIANDLRWMNSGPLAGLGEIELPALQPGSSIMPGKVNPVIPEAVAMAAAQVIGNDTTVTLAGQSGNFELNVMLPVIAYNLLQSIELLANASRSLADQAIAGFSVRRANLEAPLARNPILVTALNPIIGYTRAAAIAKKAYAQGRDIIEVAAEETDLDREQLTQLLDPARLARGGLQDCP